MRRGRSREDGREYEEKMGKRRIWEITNWDGEEMGRVDEDGQENGWRRGRSINEKEMVMRELKRKRWYAGRHRSRINGKRDGYVNRGNRLIPQQKKRQTLGSGHTYLSQTTRLKLRCPY